MNFKNSLGSLCLRKGTLFLGLLLWMIPICSAQAPAPGKPQTRGVIIKNATLHLGNGKVVRNAWIRFDQGRITAIDSVPLNDLAANLEVIDAGGKHIYPGLIAVNTNIGLNEIDMVRSTRDYHETGENNADVRSIIAYNAESKIIPTLRSNGVLLAQISPTGGSVSGNSSVVQLDAWNWEDAAVKNDDALHIHWPRMSIQRGWWAEPGDLEKLQVSKEIEALELIFQNAKTYCLSRPETVNLKLEGFRKVFSGQKQVFVHANGAREMISAVLFMEKFGIAPVIVGANESYLITGFLRKHGIRIVLERTHTLPSLADEDYDIYYKLPRILNDSGILFCITDIGSWQQRNLPFQAGTAVAYGLTSEQALSSITANTAKILGIDQNYGTLEAGKSATLFISEGDVLDMITSRVTAAWIDGRLIDLNNSQKVLHEKYNKKYFGD